MATSRKMEGLLGFIAGLTVGGIGMGLIAGVVSYVVSKREEQGLHRGWTLMPVVVASRQLAPGTRLTLDAVAQRSMPEQLATSSVVKPDSATYVMDQVLIAPLSQGDPLHWAFFSSSRPISGSELASPRDSAVWAACDAALTASTTVSRDERTPADIRARIMSEVRP